MRFLYYISVFFVCVSTFGTAEKCQISLEEDVQVRTCLLSEDVKVVERSFKNRHDLVAIILRFQNDLLVEKKSYSMEGTETYRVEYEHRGDGSFLEAIFYGKRLNSKLRKKVIDGTEVVIEKYGFNSRTGKLASIDILEGKTIVKRQVIEEGEHSYTYSFHYEGKNITGFEAFNLNGDLIGEYYLNQLGQLPNPIEEERVKIAIVDSGFDHQHEAIRDHLKLNELDHIDGIDNDSDGFIDNYLGTHFDENNDLGFINFAKGFIQGPSQTQYQESKHYGIPFEVINLSHPGEVSSHGTHVASLALRDLEYASLLPFAGDYGDARYLKLMNKKIRSEGIHFVNLSFAFPHYSTGELPKSTLVELKNMIVDNPKTIFFVAAGNDGEVLKSGRFSCIYPACYKLSNVVTVGATSDSDWRNDHNYKMAEFSNRSDEFVDVFAPGNKVNGALLGKMSIRYTGTSMASPVALNVAARLKEEFPHKSAVEIKDALLQSALKIKGIVAKHGVLNFDGAKKILEEN